AWLWGKAIRPQGTVVQSYMANRGITFPLPRTIRYLPASDGYPPQMICAFGLFFEDADGKIAEPTKVTAIHRTLLKPDGSKADVYPNKKFVGSPTGKPIVLAPPHDGYAALAITEGIEDGLTAAQALGIAVWAAGSAGNMPKLVSHIPAFTESVT